MGPFLFFAFSWWAILLRVVALIHFIRRRPDFFWLWIILVHWVGALVYIAVEVVPDAGLLQQEFHFFTGRKRIRELEGAVVDNPSAGNFEELGELYFEQSDYARARHAYDRALALRTDSIDPFYRRGVAEVRMKDFAAAIPDLARVVESDPSYDFHQAMGLLAEAYAQTSQPEKARALFQQATAVSTSSEAYYNYATFLSSQGQNAEARRWAEQLLAKRRNMPGYLVRRERPWFAKARTLLRTLPNS